jgi:DNA-binding XRE family transcriptional regulator
MVKRPDLKAFKKKALQDKKFKAEYETLRPEFELICKFIKARKNAHYSQEELAKRLNLQQPAVARLEKGGYSTTSVAKLSKVANALGYSIKISLEPKKRS